MVILIALRSQILQDTHNDHNLHWFLPWESFIPSDFTQPLSNSSPDWQTSNSGPCGLELGPWFRSDTKSIIGQGKGRSRKHKNRPSQTRPFREGPLVAGCAGRLP
jgi:hypothetical protein